MSPTEMAYRKTAIGGASGFGLLIALYDTLAGDLRRAAEAERSSNLESRTREVNHAFLVIGYLEDWVNRGSGGELADFLVRFYKSLRRKMMQAQVKRSPEILEDQMAGVLKIREVWQQIELRGSSAAPKAPAWSQAPSDPEVLPSGHDRIASSWSA